MGMGLAESAPATPATTPTADGKGTIGYVKRHFSRGGGTSAGAELVRSPSAPAHVSLATLVPGGTKISKRHKDSAGAVGVGPAHTENSGRVTELADGSWAFFKNRRSSLDTPSEPDCHYTCHPQCRELVTLDCRGTKDDSDGSCSLSLSEMAPTDTDPQQVLHPLTDDQVTEVASSTPLSEDEKAARSLDVEELRLLLDEHNAALPYPGLEMTMQTAAATTTATTVTTTGADLDQTDRPPSLVVHVNVLPDQCSERKTNSNTNMTLLATALIERGLTVADLPSNLFLGDWEEDGAHFRGFIRVHMNLCRPISVVAGTRPPSIYDILKEDQTIEKTLTSFYLPRDTIKALHITSTTTTSEVIVALLKKFKVVDNPRKFALYERYFEEGETAKVKMRRIADNETPLVLALRWSRETNCNKMFVLQENDTGDILWEAFSLPELNNFLRILDREEEEYKRMVREKYQQLAAKIQEAMDRFSPPSTFCSAAPEIEKVEVAPTEVAEATGELATAS